MSTVTSIQTKQAALRPPKILAVVAHPDDEYHFAVTLHKATRELGGTVDQVIITDGAGGHRYTRLAEQLYGVPLSSHAPSLREVRREETAAAGQILGIRQHFFLNQPDTGFTLSQSSAITDWDHLAVTGHLDRLLDTGDYDFVFILLPTHDTHGHHKATALLTIEAVERLPKAQRPAILAADAAHEEDRMHASSPLLEHPSIRPSHRQYSISRKHAHPLDPSLTYEVIANWVIAAHKSQGLFQMEAGRHTLERFWLLDCGHGNAAGRADGFFQRLQPSSAQTVSIPA